ncbi:nitrate reductase molybdenum cofactor assembly chaperone [Acetobacter cerevisiae]|uniref:Nitrate reductase n=1 Tax=Acetobacter cerevisiae TaxID=178900 RepID=A0A149V7C5_9PROT|nr:nitrate reductase molybdenum cofactor assembly chaperone [Acetobacter cerevisiae]KXV75833.1 nitrate reductase [Acetobacter cerevisiae]
MPQSLSFLCQISAILLRYPDDVLMQEGAALEAAVMQSGLDDAVKDALCSLCQSITQRPLLDVQSQYVQLFDMSPSLSLYLFQHVHGDSRLRGQAMVDLLEEYRGAGLDMQDNELPDFLPAYLEYASLCPAEKTQALLTEVVDILSVLEERLRSRTSAYASVFTALRAVSDRVPDEEIVQAHLRDTAVMDDPSMLDARYEEKPVTFDHASGQAGCQTGCGAGSQSANQSAGHATPANEMTGGEQ